MLLRPIATNFALLILPNTTKVWFSYETPVLLLTPDGTLYQTDKTLNRTTARHMRSVDFSAMKPRIKTIVLSNHALQAALKDSNKPQQEVPTSAV